MPEWRLGSTSKALRYLGQSRWTQAGLMPTASSYCPLTQPQFTWLYPLPVIGLLTMAGILEARAEEHVLVNATTHAVEVRCNGAPLLDQWQQHSQRFLPVPRPVPPKGGEDQTGDLPKTWLPFPGAPDSKQEGVFEELKTGATFTFLKIVTPEQEGPSLKPPWSRDLRELCLEQ